MTTAREAIIAVMETYPVGTMVQYTDVAELTDFSPVTVSGILSDLMREGYLRKGMRGEYARAEQPLPKVPLTFDLIKVRADGSRIVMDEAGELYVITLVVI